MVHVLIVDDDVALLQALPEALRLRMSPVTVDTCDSAMEALERIAGTDYDAIVTDIKMPGMDGLALLAEIRTLRPDTPTLLITGHGEHDLAVQALRGGAYDFIQKPIDRDYFVASLTRAMRMRELARQLEEQKHALEQHASELERIVEERTRELIEANRAKDQFLAVLSHELRTPLTPIQASVELLRRGAHDPDRVRRAADVIERNVRLQTNLVNDLLDLSRIIRGKLSLECRPVALAELVAQTLDGLRSEAEAAGLALVWEPPPEEIVLELDAFRMQQIVLNLTGNAIKYTPAGGLVSLALTRAGDHARLTVADTGIGISPEALPQIFEMFHQENGSRPGAAMRGCTDAAGGGPSIAECRALRIPGLGIGLALVRSLARMHGGEVWAESDGPGRGSRFLVELPLARGHREELSSSPNTQHPTPNTQYPTPDTPRPGILLVEDSADSRETLAEVLELLGYRVREAASADEALALLSEWSPEVILSDIGLPGTDGYELIRRVRAMPQHARVVALAATGYSSAEDRERALAAGFDGHVAKPLDPSALDRQLREMLGANT